MDVARDRYDRLLALLENDPGNLSLLSATAEAALSANRPERARDLLDRYAKLSPLPAREAGLAALCALRCGDHAQAISLLGPLLAEHPADPSLRYNLAWCLAKTGELAEAEALLDARTVDGLPQAAALKVQLAHNRGSFDEAFATGRHLLERHADDTGLLASMSVLAIDLEEVDLAAEYATRAGEHPEAITTLGVLALRAHNIDAASKRFDQADILAPEQPRTLLGKGLVALIRGEARDAGRQIERAASHYATHLGSWIAAGWAHLLAGDHTQSRRCFETAYRLDDTFAECHGSLAVLDLLDGRIVEAKERAAIALRLDRQSFTGAFAQACLSSLDGRERLSKEILSKAMRTPVGRDGHTIAHALAQLSVA